MPNTYTELLKTTVGTATSSVTLSSIPSGYTDLVLVCNFINTIGQTDHGVRFNGDTASNYSRTQLYGTGSVAGSNRGTNETSMNFLGYIGTSWGVSIMQIMNYSNTTTYKTALSRANGASDLVIAAAGLWRNTSAITSLDIIASAGNFAVGSTFSLYGIANADLGSAKATGGMITEDANYWYHTFAASGTFTPKVALTADYLVVAGGGGGGCGRGGGGGAGGYRAITAESFSVTNYAVTVGGGGTAATTFGAGGGVGSNSILSSTTSTGGGGGGAYGPLAGTSGGSGGGSGGTNATPTTGGTASPSGQGNNGGVGLNLAGAGGGGAGAVGGNADGAGTGGNGGNGLASSINGTSITYAGGGGGGSSVAGTGGTGGGGAGSIFTGSPDATAGTTNTGGGGGGGAAGGNVPGRGGAGGSGIVIIRYAK
jgi:hypothetical protein